MRNPSLATMDFSRTLDKTAFRLQKSLLLNRRETMMSHVYDLALLSAAILYFLLHS